MAVVELPVHRPYGEANGQAVLTERLVREILADRRPSTYWADRLGCAESTIRHLRTGRTWRWIPRPDPMPEWPRGVNAR